MSVLDFLNQSLTNLFDFISRSSEPLRLWMDHIVWQNPAYYLLLPEISLTIVGIFMIFLNAMLSDRRAKIVVPIVGISVQLFSIVMTYVMMYTTSRYFTFALGQFWGGLETVDPFSLFWDQMTDWTTIVVILLSMQYPAVDRVRGEYFGILTFASAAIMFMASSSDVFAIYLMTEFSSITLYVLVGMLKENRFSNEAVMKFFLVGSFAGILILFGAAILYGLTGTTNLYDYKFIFTNNPLLGPVAALALTLVAAGMGFKIAIAPFHNWAPDTYEGAPTPITAFISVAPKVGGICVWCRFFLLGLVAMKGEWVYLVAILSAATLLIGNLGALHQFNLKRLLAYSSIAHMGYVLMGIATGALQYAPVLETDTDGFRAALFYMFAYLFFNLGAFAVVVFLESQGIAPDMRNYKGLVQRSPLLAFLMTLFMLALAGIPFTSGFIAKWVLFRAILQVPELLWLAVLAGVLTLLALYYYIKIPYYMFFFSPEGDAKPMILPPLYHPHSLALLICTAGVLLMSILPKVFYDFASNSYFLNYNIY